MSVAEVTSSIDINAPADRVWAILCDFISYPEWNPFIIAIEGKLRTGARLTMRVAPPGGSELTVRPRLSVVRRPHRLSWQGQVLAPGLFDGEHRFDIQSINDGSCRFYQSESYTGVLAPHLGPGLIETTRAGFTAMNQAIKQRAEIS